MTLYRSHYYGSFVPSRWIRLLCGVFFYLQSFISLECAAVAGSSKYSLAFPAHSLSLSFWFFGQTTKTLAPMNLGSLRPTIQMLCSTFPSNGPNDTKLRVETHQVSCSPTFVWRLVLAEGPHFPLNARCGAPERGIGLNSFFSTSFSQLLLIARCIKYIFVWFTIPFIQWKKKI